MEYTLEKFLTESKVRISKVCLTLKYELEKEHRNIYLKIEVIDKLLHVLNSEIDLYHNYIYNKEQKDNFIVFLQERHFKDSIIETNGENFYLDNINLLKVLQKPIKSC